MRVHIYKPSKSATQSGRLRTKRWVMEFEDQTHTVVDSVNNTDTNYQIQLSFNSKEDAITFAQENKYTFTVEEPCEYLILPKSYSDTFSK